jgi:hypothetical protein
VAIVIVFTIIPFSSSFTVVQFSHHHISHDRSKLADVGFGIHAIYGFAGFTRRVVFTGSTITVFAIFTVTVFVSLGVHPVVLQSRTLYAKAPFVLFERVNVHFCA